MSENLPHFLSVPMGPQHLAYPTYRMENNYGENVSNVHSCTQHLRQMYWSIALEQYMPQLLKAINQVKAVQYLNVHILGQYILTVHCMYRHALSNKNIFTLESNFNEFYSFVIFYHFDSWLTISIHIVHNVTSILFI